MFVPPTMLVFSPATCNVSILARSFERALPSSVSFQPCHFPVSILARSFERALQAHLKILPMWIEFQSSPALSSGRYRRTQGLNCFHICFNPRPLFRAGAT